MNVYTSYNTNEGTQGDKEDLVTNLKSKVWLWIISISNKYDNIFCAFNLCLGISGQ